MLRSFRSELTKFRRRSVLAGVPALVAVAVGLTYFGLSHFTDPRFEPAARAVPTPLGLVTLVSFPQRFLDTVVIAMVTANLAAEWSQGTLRNLLVREPGRLRLLAGKMLALLLFVAVSASLALLIAAGFVLVAAPAQGVSTAPWLSLSGFGAFAGFWGSELLALAGVSLLGMLVAVATRSLGTAVGISVGYVLIVEDLVGRAWPDGAVWLPVHLFRYLWGTPSGFTLGTPPMGFALDLTGALLCMLGFVAVSAVLFRRMDVLA
jgi:ABC-type transport system involved in multi-copper enzyme maturation permease subunit